VAFTATEKGRFALTETNDKKISEYEFTVRAIKKLRKPPYKGIHSVYSGFNQAFKKYFNKNPVEVTNQFANEGKISIRPVKGGVMLYLPEDAPTSASPGSVLKEILGDDERAGGLEILGPADDEGNS
jgi:hypothetical protein